jgi:multicomponent Na+:H+ antiporter subunit E
VTSLVLWPGGIRSRVIRFRTHLQNEVAKVVLGNSITLTPGTVTVDIEGDLFTVHALSDTAAESVLDGDMERRVAWVFGEPVPDGPADAATR